MNAIPFAHYLRGFDYDEREAMKIQLLELYRDGKAQVIDIRFHEEYEALNVGIGQHIPLNELPDRISLSGRLHELPTDKILVVACPMTDRSNMAYSCLAGKGFDVRYLQGGLLGLMDRLKGGRASDIQLPA